MEAETEAARLERLDKDAARGQRLRRGRKTVATRYQQDMEQIDADAKAAANPQPTDTKEK